MKKQLITSTALSYMTLNIFKGYMAKGHIEITLDHKKVCRIVKKAKEVPGMLKWTYTEFKRYEKKELRKKFESKEIELIKIVANRDEKLVCYVKN